MKKLLISIITILMISCSDEVKISKKIDGTWIIEKLEVTAAADPDYFKKVEDLGTIHFEHCKRSERNDNAGYCTGHYDIKIGDSTSVSDFTFNTTININRDISTDTQEYDWVNIKCNSSDWIVNSEDLFINNNWRVESLEGESCVLINDFFGNEQKLFLKK